MPQHCTILSPVDDPRRLVETVKELVGKRGEMSVEVSSQEWASITIRSLDSALLLNRRIYQEGGDAFSRMMLGMLSYFDRVAIVHQGTKERVIRRLEKMRLAIGVIAEPDFDEGAGHFEIIFGLAGAFDAMIWNGAGVLDPSGSLILDGEGESEVAD